MNYDYEGNINDDIELDKKTYTKAEVDAIINLALLRGSDKARQEAYQREHPTDNQRTWSYYENLRKTDKAKYIDPRTQTQMFQDRMELGDSFMDGSYDKNVGVT